MASLNDVIGQINTTYETNKAINRQAMNKALVEILKQDEINSQNEKAFNYAKSNAGITADEIAYDSTIPLDLQLHYLNTVAKRQQLRNQAKMLGIPNYETMDDLTLDSAVSQALAENKARINAMQKQKITAESLNQNTELGRITIANKQKILSEKNKQIEANYNQKAALEEKTKFGAIEQTAKDLGIPTVRQDGTPYPSAYLIDKIKRKRQIEDANTSYQRSILRMKAIRDYNEQKSYDAKTNREIGKLQETAARLNVVYNSIKNDPESPQSKIDKYAQDLAAYEAKLNLFYTAHPEIPVNIKNSQNGSGME